MQALNFQIYYVEGRPTKITFCPVPSSSCSSHYPILRDIVMKHLGVPGWRMDGEKNLEYLIPFGDQCGFDEQMATVIVSLCQATVSETMDALMKFGYMQVAWEAYQKVRGVG